MYSKLRSYSCHPKSVDLSNIELIFLPANTTSHVQPLDQGIIANFKRHYRYLYTMNWLCPAIEEGETLSKISMRPALQYCVKAWGMVTPRTLRSVENSVMLILFNQWRRFTTQLPKSLSNLSRNYAKLSPIQK